VAQSSRLRHRKRRLDAFPAQHSLLLLKSSDISSRQSAAFQNNPVKLLARTEPMRSCLRHHARERHSGLRPQPSWTGTVICRPGTALRGFSCYHRCPPLHPPLIQVLTSAPDHRGPLIRPSDPVPVWAYSPGCSFWTWQTKLCCEECSKIS
jgi:hypothetical protein